MTAFWKLFNNPPGRACKTRYSKSKIFFLNFSLILDWFFKPRFVSDAYRDWMYNTPPSVIVHQLHAVVSLKFGRTQDLAELAHVTAEEQDDETESVAGGDSGRRSSPKLLHPGNSVSNFKQNSIGQCKTTSGLSTSYQVTSESMIHCSLWRKWKVGGRGERGGWGWGENEVVWRQKYTQQNTWQWMKHAKLSYSHATPGWKENTFDRSVFSQRGWVGGWVGVGEGGISASEYHIVGFFYFFFFWSSKLEHFEHWGIWFSV